MRLVREIIQIRKLSCIYHIAHFTINWHILSELLRIGISIMSSCHVCGIMINNGVKSVYVFMVPVLVSIMYISIRNDLSYKLKTQTGNMNFSNDGQSVVMLGWVMRYDSNGNNNDQYHLLFWSIPTSVPYQSPYFQQNTSEFWYAGLPLFEQGSDGITYAPDIIIVGIVKLYTGFS